MIDWSKWKDVKINVGKMAEIVFDRVENIAGKGENAGHQHFLLFPQCFPKASFSGLLKVGIMLKMVESLKPFPNDQF